jgi:hypothetical protein
MEGVKGRGSFNQKALFDTRSHSFPTLRLRSLRCYILILIRIPSCCLLDAEGAWTRSAVCCTCGPAEEGSSTEVQWTRNNCELGKRHSKLGKEDGKGKGGAWWPTVCLSMYSITENIYYSQLSSVAILLQPDPNCFTSYNTRKGLGSLSPNVLSSCGLPDPPTCLLLSVNEARSYFASTIPITWRN